MKINENLATLGVCACLRSCKPALACRVARLLSQSPYKIQIHSKTTYKTKVGCFFLRMTVLRYRVLHKFSPPTPP